MLGNASPLTAAISQKAKHTKQKLEGTKIGNRQPFDSISLGWLYVTEGACGPKVGTSVDALAADSVMS